MTDLITEFNELRNMWATLALEGNSLAIACLQQCEGKPIPLQHAITRGVLKRLEAKV